MLQAKASIHIMKCDENNGVDDESIQVAHPDLAQTETFGKQ